MGKPAAALALLLFAAVSLAGWTDLVLTSLENGQPFHQGENITLTLVVKNNGLTDGSAAYIANVTLIPTACINGGAPLMLPGVAIVCPNVSADQGCTFRFRNATLRDTFAFENVTTQETCPNGTFHYSFSITGNTEVGSGGYFAATVKNASETFELRFTGALFCGDGACTEWRGENCSTCQRDCGRCGECATGRVDCMNDSIATCLGGFWQITTPCEAGCYYFRGEPACVAPCREGERGCAALNTATVCVNKRWKNETCMFGCLLGECKGNCDTAGCNDTCADSVRYHNGACDRVTGKCSYLKENCSFGCAGDACAQQGGGGGEGAGLLPAVAAAALVVAAAIAAYLKFIKKPGQPQPPA